MTHAAAEIREIAKTAAPLAAVYVTDREYQEPTKRWLSGPFNAFFRGQLWQWQGDEWQDIFDCDNFAVMWLALCLLAHGRSAGAKSEGLAVGEVHYVRERGGGHAINCAVVRGRMVFIEPQTGEFLRLTQKERESIWYVRF